WPVLGPSFKEQPSDIDIIDFERTMPLEDILSEFQECEPVQLEPFIHQVGGHSSILCLDERTVCKPLIKQELKFYEKLPTCMKKFTPEYRGVVQVRFEEDPDGYITVAAYPPKSFRYQVSSKKKPNKSRRIRIKNSGSIEIEIESELDDLFVEEEQVAAVAGATPPPPLQPLVPAARLQLSKLRRSATQKEKESHCQKFMLLENITWRFEYPCILDLKMGTRQYADDATPAKIESQSAKAAMTTSVQLGVRICGMQIYQVTTGKFVCRNKYYGRKLSVDGFKEGICQFLHNGRRLRTDAILPLIEKLNELKAVLATLDTYRFYTSSLLLAYEGLDPEYCGDDEPSMMTDDDSSNDSTTMDSTTGSSTSAASLNSESVDVRMIDFAHSLHDGMGYYGKEHVGPDTGYIFGLQNLIKVLQEICDEQCYVETPDDL
ncbi:Inositol hexakisphosphate kinase 1, partial [Orchesella cincta]